MNSVGPGNRTLWREPLLHFTVAAAVLVGAQRWHQHASRPELRVTKEWLDTLARDYELKTGHRPDSAERAKLLDDYIEEEVLFREAQKSGHEEDPRVRHLLALTMREAMEPVVADPSDAELEELRAKSPETFRFPAEVSFEHASFKSTDAIPPGTLETLRGGGTAGMAAEMRLPNPLPETWIPQIGRMFGDEFAEALANCKEGEWSGPINSTRGVHFVKILKYTAPREMPMTEVRPALITKWTTDRQKAAVSGKVAELRKGYRIIVPQGEAAGE